jgi:uncharacterized membrane protein YhhN
MACTEQWLNSNPCGSGRPWALTHGWLFSTVRDMLIMLPKHMFWLNIHACMVNVISI